MDSMDGKEIKIRCETCRGRGMDVAGEGHEFPCLDCCGFGFTREVFRLAPKPLTLREQLEQKEQDNG